MKRYRIIQGQGYNGCFPITVYWVQVRKSGFWGDKWSNVKGFDTYQNAENLLQILK